MSEATKTFEAYARYLNNGTGKVEELTKQLSRLIHESVSAEGALIPEFKDAVEAGAKIAKDVTGYHNKIRATMGNDAIKRECEGTYTYFIKPRNDATFGKITEDDLYKIYCKAVWLPKRDENGEIVKNNKDNAVMVKQGDDSKAAPKVDTDPTDSNSGTVIDSSSHRQVLVSNPADVLAFGIATYGSNKVVDAILANAEILELLQQRAAASEKRAAKK